MSSEFEADCTAQKCMPLTSNAALLHSNDEESNHDMSLEKEKNGAQIDDIVEVADVLKDDHNVSIANEWKDEIEKNELIEAVDDPNVSSILTDLKKEIEKNELIEADDDHSVSILTALVVVDNGLKEAVGYDKELKEAVGCESIESDKLIEDKIEISDNIVLRKLLRGPRYFDLLDSGRGACYKCGEEGHTALHCMLVRRRRPCFVCGSLDHNAKQCAKGRDCFICKKGGHRAKDCPEKRNARLYLSAKICLKCGQSGHEMFSCKSDYSSDDLKEIQCYICKKFGHLCCAKYTFTVGGKVSCYRCGQSGHTGLACKGFHGDMNDVESPSSCYRCGKGGHFARECTASAEASKRLCGPNENESPSSCYKCGGGGHFARECTNLAKPYTRMIGGPNKMESPSTCYKCGQGGHFARECTNSAKANTRLHGGPNKTESPSSCYKCGGEGHFARECSNSPMAHTRLHGYPNGSGFRSSCYKCGEGGHFARECTTSAKSLKRNRELSAPKYKFSKQSKWKRTHYEGEFSTPVKSKSRGGWTTEHPGDLSRRKARNKGWTTPATPTS